MAASLIRNNETEDKRFEYIVDIWKSIVGKKNVGFDNPVYLSEKRSANRNHALAHLMMENNVFPEDTEINTEEKKPSYMALKQDECNATVEVTEKTGLEVVNTESFDVNVCLKKIYKVIN